MPRPVHFEISAEDPEKAAEFYERTFGWKVERWDGPTEYWLITTGDEGEHGIDGGMMRREDQPPGTVNTVDVPDLDEYVGRAVESGGKVVVPRMSIPGLGYMAYVMDPEGNVFGLMEMDERAQ